MMLITATIEAIADGIDAQVREMIEDAVLDDDRQELDFTVYVNADGLDVEATGTALFSAEVESDPEVGYRHIDIKHVDYILHSIDICPDEDIPVSVKAAVGLCVYSALNKLYNKKTA